VSDGNATAISVGQITVTLRAEPAHATIACGHVICDVGPAAGKRFFDELTKIHEALLAAYEVLAQPGDVHRPASPEEIHLANKLIALEITRAIRARETP
jgi:hypothetical protein